MFNAGSAGLLGQVDAPFSGGILPDLLNGPRSFRPHSYSLELPLVLPQVDDVLDEEEDPDGQLVVLGSALQTLEVLIHAYLHVKKI